MDLKKLLRLLPDKIYLHMMYYYHMKKKLNLKSPKTLNEKLQWLKLYDRKREYIQMVDKIEAKKYVAGIIGEEHIIPTICVWDSPEDIDFASLPERFVLKSNHDSKGVIVCHDKSKINQAKIKDFFKKRLKVNGYWYGREWPYKLVKPYVFAEKIMSDDENTDEFTDYKFYCFNGVAECVLICLDRNTGDTKFYFFDRDWNLKRYNKRGMEAPEGFTLPKPKCLDEMFEIASKLSEGIPFSRIDLYQSKSKVYFGEITLYPGSGFDANRMPDIDKMFGEKVDLSIVNN